MTYVALLRGINVGGNRKVPMAKLAETFAQLGLTQVKTFIASGNVIFNSDENRTKLIEQIEAAIERDFGFHVHVLLRSRPEIAQLVKDLPDNWVNDAETKCDVLFLDTVIDTPDILKQAVYDPTFEDVLKLPGTLVWRIARQHAKPGQTVKLTNAAKYAGSLTIRNPNTIRKIHALMQIAADTDKK